MEITDKYNYHCRPGYGSDKLLIEFITGVENETFVSDVLDALKNIHPVISGTVDLWMNDEFLFEVSSDKGNFTLSKDIWGFAFILSDNTPACISIIDKLLAEDNRFEKVEVDFSKYR